MLPKRFLKSSRSSIRATVDVYKRQIMYGISPTDTVGAEFGLTPVMNLTSSLLAAVSYTHLDVYKRQVIGFNSSKILSIKDESGTM